MVKIAQGDYTLTIVNDGADGRTPFIHNAYSDNKDGTGFINEDRGQRYHGFYSDYNQKDSTDKTRYKWIDRFTNINVGSINILRNTKFDGAYRLPGTRYTVSGVNYQECRIPKYRGIYNSYLPNPTTVHHVRYDENFSTYGTVLVYDESDGTRHRKGIYQQIENAEIELRPGVYTFSADVYATGAGTKVWTGFWYYKKDGSSGIFSSQSSSIYPDVTNKWIRVSENIVLKDDIDYSKEIRFYMYCHYFKTNSIIYLMRPKLEQGNVATPYNEHTDDVDTRLDKKADQQLTTEQINLLNEKMQQMDAEVKSRAALEEMSNFMKDYLEWVRTVKEDSNRTRAEMQSMADRVIGIRETLGALKRETEFLDTYMRQANEGFEIGRMDGSSSMFFSPNGRISMFSAGREVMFIDKGLIRIDNGVFVISMQIGRFQTSQSQSDPDINVIRWVGDSILS